MQVVRVITLPRSGTHYLQAALRQAYRCRIEQFWPAAAAFRPLDEAQLTAGLADADIAAAPAGEPRYLFRFQHPHHISARGAADLTLRLVCFPLDMVVSDMRAFLSPDRYDVSPSAAKRGAARSIDVASAAWQDYLRFLPHQVAFTEGLVANGETFGPLLAQARLGTCLDFTELQLSPDGRAIAGCRVEPILRYEDLTPERAAERFFGKLERSLGPPDAPWPAPRPNLARRYWQDPVDRDFSREALLRTVGYFHRFLETFYPERLAAIRPLLGPQPARVA